MKAQNLDPNYPFQALLLKLPVVSWTTDLGLKTTSLSGAGLNKPHAPKQLFESLDKQPPRTPIMSAHIKALKGEGASCQLEQENYYYQVAVEPIKNSAGKITGAAGLALDLTEQKLLESQFKNSQKMESLGRLTGGVAHDFNNLFTVILNYAEMLENDVANSEDAKSKLEAISNCASQASSLTSQLLQFSRQNASQEQSVNLNSLLGSIGSMLTRVIGEDIELDFKFQDQLAPIHADPNHVLNIVMTLAQSARERMPNGGRLSIQTQGKEHDVVLSVCDNAKDGFNQENDLNFAMLERSVKQCKGHIEVSSKAGSGTTFQVCFDTSMPTESSQQGNPMTEIEKVTSLPQEAQTVLIVEDEDIVRQVASDIIRGGGFEVLEASNAASAIKLCEEAPKPVNLVLTDLVMPKMNGPELIKQLSSKFPDISVVYMSGYNSEAAFSRGVSKKNASFIQKPFMPNTLLKVIQDTLSGKVVDVE
ncbi:MAG: response regulator [Deltaproteobacteria bacterium]|nr:response regulator [Deltaproteobacteria bacterium]